MPFNKKISKAIQIHITTDKKLLDVIQKFKVNEGVNLKSRNQVIDTLATRYLNN